MIRLLVFMLLLCNTAFADQVDVRYIIEDKVNDIPFRDAIYYKDIAEYEAKVADGSHEKERSSRVDGFRQILENPPVTPEPTEEQLLQEKLALAEQQTAAVNRMIEIDSQIAASKEKKGRG